MGFCGQGQQVKEEGMVISYQTLHDIYKELEIKRDQPLTRMDLMMVLSILMKSEFKDNK